MDKRSNMPHHYTCCVPGCTNSFRNAPNLKFYQIPKDVEPRKKYQVYKAATFSIEIHCIPQQFPGEFSLQEYYFRLKLLSHSNLHLRHVVPSNDPKGLCGINSDPASRSFRYRLIAVQCSSSSCLLGKLSPCTF